MNRKQARLVETLGFFVVYFGFYLFVLGPMIGAALPGFDKPAFSSPGFRPTGELPATARGWLLIILIIPSLLGYMYLRARLSGKTMQQFWEPE